jgi:phosphate starvation-inducible PhoH-like protein
LAQTARAAKGSHKQIRLEIENNDLLRELAGHFDENLALIEDRLDIEASARGNIITLKGAEHAVKTGRAVLEGLLQRLDQGEQIGPEEVMGSLAHLDPLAHVAKAGRKPRRKSREGGKSLKLLERTEAENLVKISTARRHLKARSRNQSHYLTSIEKNELTFGIGPAGTGKTYLAVAYAAAALEKSLVERIILSRPAVEAGERLGFLPGDMRDKIDPYLRPLYDALDDLLGRERVEQGIEGGTIEIAPLAFMRGRTLSNAFIILDEAQNTTSVQMKMFLTRLGEGSRMVVTGDPSQIDLPRGVRSGLDEAVGLLEKVEGVGLVRFGKEDVVRHNLVTRIIRAYDHADKKGAGGRRSGNKSGGKSDRGNRDKQSGDGNAHN